MGTIAPQGSDLRRLVRFRGTPCTSVRDLSWSPDGRRLLAERHVSWDGAFSTGLSVVDLRGASKRVPLKGIAPMDEYVPDWATYVTATTPSFAPDGRRFAYMRKRWEDFERAPERAGIWIARRDGSGARRLRAIELSDGSLRWSPRGGSIAYRAVDGCASEIDADDEGRGRHPRRAVDDRPRRDGPAQASARRRPPSPGPDRATGLAAAAPVSGARRVARDGARRPSPARPRPATRRRPRRRRRAGHARAARGVRP